MFAGCTSINLDININHMPPAPPTKIKFEVIRGMVSDLYISQGEENFLFTNADKTAGGAAAVGLAVGGLAGAATGAIYNSGDAADKLDFFICRVGEEIVKGRFGKVSFADEDAVEVVGLREGSQFNAYAVIRPSDRVIWMYPHCTRGSKAYKKFSLMAIGLVSFVTPAFFFGLFELISDRPFIGITAWLAASASGAVICSIVLGFTAWRFMKFAHIADDIFEGLGFDNPSNVDLPKRLKPMIKGLTYQECWVYHPHARWVFKY